MRTVWKFELPVDDEFTLALPLGAKLLHVAAQRDKPCLWALVDDDMPTRPRSFQTRGTGHDADEVGDYLGTYQLRGGAFVGHVFEGTS